MPILKLEYIGEPLIAQMLMHSATARDLVSGNSDFHYAVDPEAPLWKWCGRRFDKAHRLDIGLSAEQTLSHTVIDGGAIAIHIDKYMASSVPKIR
jgi:hypothetical protein